MGLPQLSHGVSGERGAAPVEFEGRNLYVRDALGEQGDHGEAIGGRGHGTHSDLLPRDVGRHQQHLVQGKLPESCHCRDDVADVRRVEGPSQNADPLERRLHGGGF